MASALSTLRGGRQQLPPEIRQAITVVAQQYGVDPTVMMAILRQENGALDAKAVGRAGEVGLFQIMPQTAISYMPAQGRTPQERLAFVSQALLDPGVNTRVAAAHIKRLSSMWPDDPRKVFAAYNGGPTAMANAERDAGAAGTTWEAALRRPGVTKYYTNASALLAEERGAGVQAAGPPSPVRPREAGAARLPDTGPGPAPVAKPPPRPTAVTVPPGIPGPTVPDTSIPRMGLVPGAPPPTAPATMGAQRGVAVAATPEETRLGLDAGPAPSAQIPLEQDLVAGAPSVTPTSPRMPSIPRAPAPSPPLPLEQDVVTGVPSIETGPRLPQLPRRPEPPVPMDMDIVAGAPSVRPAPGATSEWEGPTLGAVPQDVRMPGLPPSPAGDIETALSQLTTEELADLYEYLNEQTTFTPPVVDLPAPRRYYHMGVEVEPPLVQSPGEGLTRAFDVGFRSLWQGGR